MTAAQIARSLARRLILTIATPSDRRGDSPLRFRPQLTELTERNAPGSLLDGVLSAALDPVAGWFGEAHPAAIPNAEREPQPGSVIRIAVPHAERTAPSATVPPTVTAPATAHRERSGTGVVRIAAAADDLFLAVPPAAVLALGNSAVLPAPAAAVGEASAAPAARIRIDAAPIPAAIGEPPALVAAPRTLPLNAAIASNEYAPELPPNTAPEAVDDAANCFEDEFVLIDVLANDTDADEDDELRIDDWQLEADHGTVTQEADGRLKYTPFPNFHGTETISYTATDGRDASNTATVTITVSPANDTPLAFEDALTFGFNPQASSYSSTGSVLGSSGQTVLGNDRDIENDTMSAELAAQPSYGVVQLASDGTFTYTPPATAAADLANSPHFVLTSFTYIADDGNGGTSDPTTVYIWLKGPIGTGGTDGIPWWSAAAPVAEDDRFAIGDRLLSEGVVANDANGSLWVLTSHPSSGRLTSFRSSGTFEYDPGVDRNDADIGYVAVSSEGRFSNEAQAKGVVLKIAIWNGQNGNAVRDVEKSTVGAFTVANRNDTDGNTIADYKQETSVLGGIPVTSVGIDEVDLIKVHIGRPTGFGEQNPNETITVTVSGGDASFFQSSHREGKLGTTLKLSPSNFVGANNTTLSFLAFWVEIAAPSSKVRDVSIEAKYLDQPDSANATGIWVDFANPGGFHSTGQLPSDDADGKPYLNTYRNLALRYNPQGKREFALPFSLGTPPMFYTDAATNEQNIPTLYLTHMRNVVELEFTVTPVGVEREDSRIKIDVTRTVQSLRWRQEDGKQLGGPEGGKVMPSYRDRANDDGNGNDEDSIPKNGHVYSLDAPGWQFRQRSSTFLDGKYNADWDPFTNTTTYYQRTIHRLNGIEFVRIKFDGSSFAHDSAQAEGATTQEAADAIIPQGSRASERVEWHSWSDFTWDAPNKTWNRTANVAGQQERNHLGLGLRDINQPGV